MSIVTAMDDRSYVEHNDPPRTQVIAWGVHSFGVVNVENNLCRGSMHDVRTHWQCFLDLIKTGSSDHVDISSGA
jgi:hypothetical protein